MYSIDLPQDCIRSNTADMDRYAVAHWRSVVVAASASAPAYDRSAALDNRLMGWLSIADMVPYNREIDMDSKCPADADHMARNRMADMVSNASDADNGPTVLAPPGPMVALAAAVTMRPMDNGMCAGFVAVRRRLCIEMKQKRNINVNAKLNWSKRKMAKIVIYFLKFNIK